MKVTVNPSHVLGAYADPTCWQNSTLRYSPPEDFPAYAEKEIGRAKIMRTWITLDEYWDYKTGIYYPDYDIGVKRYSDAELHYLYDWKNIRPAPSGTKFVAYLTSHSKAADELMLNLRRLEREVLDGVITFEQYDEVVENALVYCKKLAPNIRWIEVGNEVDIASFGTQTPQEYCTLYVHCYNIVKKLNARYHWDIPLLVGGHGLTHPLDAWQYWTDCLTLIKQAIPVPQPMEFYSIHMYDNGNFRRIERDKRTELYDCLYKTGMVGRMRHILKEHHALLKKLELPELPLFWDELGRADATGSVEDDLYNAAANIICFIAAEEKDFDNVYLYPWCTFHNPVLQMSYTQFLLNPDGSYAITPNGISVKMMHELAGDRVEAAVSGAPGFEPECRAIAVKNGDTIKVVVANPEQQAEPLTLELPHGQYAVTGTRVDSAHNNFPAGHGEKTMKPTAEFLCTGSISTVLEKNAFVLYEIRPVGK